MCERQPCSRGIAQQDPSLGDVSGFELQEGEAELSLRPTGVGCLMIQCLGRRFVSPISGPLRHDERNECLGLRRSICRRCTAHTEGLVPIWIDIPIETIEQPVCFRSGHTLQREFRQLDLCLRVATLGGLMKPAQCLPDVRRHTGSRQIGFSQPHLRVWRTSLRGTGKEWHGPPVGTLSVQMIGKIDTGCRGARILLATERTTWNETFSCGTC